MEDDLRTAEISSGQPAKRVKRTELLMDITVLVKKGIIPSPSEATESNVVAKGYRETVQRTTDQLLKDEKELKDWTQLLADLELEETQPGTGSFDEKRQEAMKNAIANNGNVSNPNLYRIIMC